MTVLTSDDPVDDHGSDKTSTIPPREGVIFLVGGGGEAKGNKETL